MDEIISRDQNRVPVLAAITNDVSQLIKMLRVDPATGRLLVSAVISGAPGNLAVLNEGVLLTNTPTSMDFVGANVTASAIGNAVTVTVVGGSGGITLETDGVANTDQSLLNLISGNGITLTDDGLGGVTIDGYSPISGGQFLIGETSGLISNPTPLTGDQNTRLGELSGNLASKFQTSFFGTSAGDGATSADQSNFFGAFAGQNAANALHSNFFGLYAGESATDANTSAFFGDQTGRGATNASNSAFFGAQAGLNATGAARSLFLGWRSGLNDTVDNIPLGSFSMLFGANTNTGGYINSVAIGTGAINTFDNEFLVQDNNSPYKYVTMFSEGETKIGNPITNHNYLKIEDDFTGTNQNSSIIFGNTPFNGVPSFTGNGVDDLVNVTTQYNSYSLNTYTVTIVGEATGQVIYLGAAQTGTPQVGENVTDNTSGATGTVYIVDGTVPNCRLWILVTSGVFTAGDDVTGDTSGFNTPALDSVSDLFDVFSWTDGTTTVPYVALFANQTTSLTYATGIQFGNNLGHHLGDFWTFDETQQAVKRFNVDNQNNVVRINESLVGIGAPIGEWDGVNGLVRSGDFVNGGMYQYMATGTGATPTTAAREFTVGDVDGNYIHITPDNNQFTFGDDTNVHGGGKSFWNNLTGEVGYNQEKHNFIRFLDDASIKTTSIWSSDTVFSTPNFSGGGLDNMTVQPYPVSQYTSYLDTTYTINIVDSSVYKVAVQNVVGTPPQTGDTVNDLTTGATGTIKYSAVSGSSGFLYIQNVSGGTFNGGDSLEDGALAWTADVFYLDYILDYFDWSETNGGSGTNVGTDSNVILNHGVYVSFATRNGHDIGAQWDFNVTLTAKKSINVDGMNHGAVRFNEAYTFPVTDGMAGYALVTDGAGVVTWQPGGGVPTLTEHQIAYGDASNQMTSINDFIYDITNNVFRVAFNASTVLIANFGTGEYGFGDVSYDGNGVQLKITNNDDAYSLIDGNTYSGNGGIFFNGSNAPGSLSGVIGLGMDFSSGQDIMWLGANGIGNSTRLVVNEPVRRTYIESSGQTLFDIDLDNGIYQLGTPVANGTYFVMNDTNRIFNFYGFGGVSADRIAKFDNQNRLINLLDVDNDFNGNYLKMDDIGNTLESRFSTSSKFQTTLFQAGDVNLANNKTLFSVNDFAMTMTFDFADQVFFRNTTGDYVMTLSVGGGGVGFAAGDINGIGNSSKIVLTDPGRYFKVYTTYAGDVTTLAFGTTNTIQSGKADIVHTGSTGAVTDNIDSGDFVVGSVISFSDLDRISSTSNITIDAGGGFTITSPAGTAQTFVLSTNGGSVTMQKVTSSKWMVK